MNKVRSLAVAIALASGVAGTFGASAAFAADKYPSKPIRVIVPSRLAARPTSSRAW